MQRTTTFLLMLLMLFQHNGIVAQEDTSDGRYLFEEIDAYLYSPNHTKKRSKKYFSDTKALAEKDDAEAYYYLGLLQKDGLGTRQSFKKSKKSFKKAHELGNEKAAYCLGYYHLKGFGDVPQDYKKAYNWFKRSNEPMAKHWIAKMEFLGLGRPANKKKALKLLVSNELYNSKVLREQYKKADPPEVGFSDPFATTIGNIPVNSLYELSGFTKPIAYEQLPGIWEGELVELDWAKEKILRTLAVSMEFKKEEGVNQQLGAIIIITDSTATSSGKYSAGKLGFPQFNIPIAKQYTDYPNFTHLMTSVSEMELREVPNSGGTMVIARLTADYPVWQERANPSFMLLKKKPNLSKEALEAFAAQSNDFIKLYPNPFVEQLLVNFELPRATNVTVTVSNYYNTAPYQKTVYKGQKAKGTHTLELIDGPTSPGSYLITIAFNGKEETKIIVKN